MKKIILTVVLAAALIAGIAGCTSIDRDQSAASPGETAGPSEQVTSSLETGEDSANDQQAICPVSVKADSGIYVGQIDGNFIEIEGNGAQDGKAAKAFMLPTTLIDSFDELGLETGDKVEFNYYVNEDQQYVIISIEVAQ